MFATLTYSPRPAPPVGVRPRIMRQMGGVVAIVAGGGGAFAVGVHGGGPGKDPAAHRNQPGFHAVQQRQELFRRQASAEPLRRLPSLFNR